MQDLIKREAACRQHGNEQNDAMNAFHNAAKSFKKTSPEGKLPVWMLLSERDIADGQPLYPPYTRPSSY